MPANLCCLCPGHHRLHHAGILDIKGDPETPDGLRFFDHYGRPIEPPPIPPTHSPPNRPPPHLGLPTPHFVNPDGGHVDWACFWWNDLPSTDN
ncbi:MAG: hypothetical protein ABIV94_00900 [Acidimicrobiales bacterium]